ncbi:hypothetical protein HY490_05440 [Candidatus Woesearchaeota archaeon]|nr:hypothetical protein [Candidatus Woesearchaeota archaeon]
MSVWKLIKAHPWLVLTAAVADAAFFFLLAQLHFWIFLRVADHLKRATELLTKNIGQLAIADVPMPTDAEFVFHYHQVLQGVAMFLVGFYCLWLVTRGVSWFAAHRMTTPKISLSTFVRRFFLITTGGMIVFLAFLLSFVALIDYASFSVLPLLTPRIANVLTVALLVLLHYAYSLSCSAIGSRPYSALLLVFTQARTLVPYLALVLWVLLAVIIAILLTRVHPAAGLGWVLLMMPGLTVFRILLIQNFPERAQRVRKIRQIAL